MPSLSELQERLDKLVCSEGLDPDRGDCLDIAAAACLASRQSGFEASVKYLERFQDGCSVSVVHAVCYVGDEPFGSTRSSMNDLEEHLDFLEEDDAYSLRLAQECDDEDETEDLASRSYEISEVSSQDLVDKGVSQVFAAFAEREKNNRSEPLLNVGRVNRYVSCLLGLPQPKLKKSPAKSASMGF